MLFIVLCIINYPPEGSFEPKLKLEAVTEQESDAGKNMDNLLKEFNSKINAKDQELISKFEVSDSNKSEIIELLNKTDSDRKEIFEFISKNSIAIYHTYDTAGQYNLLSEQDNYESSLSTLVSVFKLELLEIEILKADNKYDEAVDKYILLWNKLADAYKMKNAYMIDTLCFIGILKNLGDYYYNNQDIFVSYDLAGVAKLKDDIMVNIDRTYESAFANEYNIFKTKLESSRDIWPLMDKNKLLRKMDKLYYSITEYEKNPLGNYPIEEPIDLSSVRISDFFKGYTEEVIYTISAEMFSGLSSNIIGKKNELSVYFYAMDKKNYQDVPKDYFTGEKFEVTDYPDRFEINVHTNIKLESPKKYVIIK